MIWNEDCEHLQSQPFYQIMKSHFSQPGKSEDSDLPKREKKRDLRKLSHRLRTFSKNIPKLRCLEFAEAGFYQLFQGRTSLDIGCFHCNVQIQSVRLSQDPWMEPLRWSPNCKFVENKKGSAFIRDARKIFELEGEGPDNVHTEIIIETFLLQHNQTDEKDGPMPLDKENMNYIEEDID
ncbi:hypothetical protein FSP39_005024 [Pinctada imbricata]|uniref:Uncharacterized protein n=1 Tax=Pinctada imbricata TaxID=66713 RepID=A0AA89BU22_PINIB|nr:hypothetical protein FSP39_005024 [Pinctada imbricata]